MTYLFQGERILGSLGGLFSRTWKPKKGREIKGPVLSRGKFRDDSLMKRGNNMEKRQKLELNSFESRSNPQPFLSEPSSTLERVEVFIVQNPKFIW